MKTNGTHSLSLGETTRVFRMSSSRAPGCDVGPTLNGYADGTVAAILAGCHVIRFNDAELIREFAANLELVAQRMESSRDDSI